MVEEATGKTTSSRPTLGVPLGPFGQFLPGPAQIPEERTWKILGEDVSEPGGQPPSTGAIWPSLQAGAAVCKHPIGPAISPRKPRLFWKICELITRLSWGQTLAGSG